MKKGLFEIKSLMGRMDRTILTEDVLMEATRDEIYAQYYDENNGKVKKIPRKTFDSICKLGDVDGMPERMSEFAKWLCDMYNTPKFSHIRHYSQNHYQTAFKTFRKVQKNKPEGVNLNLRSYDIDSFMAAMDYVREKGLDMSNNDIKKLGSETFYKDNAWTAIWVKTYEASTYYGRNTRWCTASDKSSYMFNDYNDNGLLVVFIDLQTQKKYQAFFDRYADVNEFRDAEDNSQDILEFIPQNILDEVTSKCKEALKRKNDDSWKKKCEKYDSINKTFDLCYNNIVDMFRIRDNRTQSFITIGDDYDFSHYDLCDEDNALILEIGDKKILCFYDETNITVGIDGILFYHKLYNEKDEDMGLIVISTHRGIMNIFDLKSKKYVSIGGVENFTEVFPCGENIAVVTLSNTYRIYNHKTNEIIRIDGVGFDFDKVIRLNLSSYKIVYQNKIYLFDTKNNVIPHEDNIDGIRAINDYDCIIQYYNDGKITYSLYSTKISEKISYNNIDTFISLQEILHWCYVLTTEDNEKCLYNFKTSSFSDSKIIPTGNDSVEFWGENILFFWDTDGILRYFRPMQNKTFSLPITITYDENNAQFFRKNRIYDKRKTIVNYTIGDMNILINLMPFYEHGETLMLYQGEKLVKFYDLE